MLVDYQCTDVTRTQLNEEDPASIFANFFVLIVLYTLVAVQLRQYDESCVSALSTLAIGPPLCTQLLTCTVALQDAEVVSETLERVPPMQAAAARALELSDSTWTKRQTMVLR